MTCSLTLQRFRFLELDTPSIPPNAQSAFRRFDSEMWTAKASQTYWRSASGQPKHSKTGVTMLPGDKISSNTINNAFFLCHWLTITRLEDLWISLNYEGEFDLEINAHTETGETVLLASHTLPRPDTGRFRVQVPFARNSLRVSFAMTAKSGGARLTGGAWQTSAVPDPTCFGLILTMRTSPEFTKRALTEILADPELAKEKPHLIVLNQTGNLEHKASEYAGCAVLHQPDLGITAGWVQGVLALEREFPTPTHFIWMHDDLIIDTDGILRLIRLNQLARQPSILSGSLLDLCRPNRLVSFIDQFVLSSNGYRQVEPYLDNHDTTDNNTLDAISIPFSGPCRLHKFISVPARVFTEIAFPFPLIAAGYEDAEFAGRALAAGFTPRAVPGLGGWLLSQPPKSPSSETMSPAVNLYFEAYSPLIHNTLYGLPAIQSYFTKVTSLIAAHLLHHDYVSGAARIVALEDFLEGWPGYRDRTYPGAIEKLETHLQTFETTSNSEELRKPHKAHLVNLKKRLEHVIGRFEAEGPELEKDFRLHLPLTYSREAWLEFFQRKNLSALVAISSVSII